jgi:hypothetical protein
MWYVPPAVKAPVAITLKACAVFEVSINEKCSVLGVVDAVAATLIPTVAVGYDEDCLAHVLLPPVGRSCRLAAGSGGLL